MIGLVVYLGIFIVVMKRLLPLPVFERWVGFTLLATLVVAGTPLGWDYYKAGWLVLALLAAWSSVLAASPPASSAPPALRPREWSARGGAPVAVK